MTTIAELASFDIRAGDDGRSQAVLIWTREQTRSAKIGQRTK
jgi:hypothetical protein